MTIVEQIDRVRDWTQKTICQQVQLKLPDDNAVDAGYEHKLVTPTAFSLYNPGKDRLPPKVIAPIPSVCVQMLDGDSSVLKGTGHLNLRYVFASWNPGLHGPDNLGTVNTVMVSCIPQGQPATDTPAAHHADQLSGTFTRNAEGWRDVWNFVDVAIRELESTDLLDGLRIVREEPIKFGPITEQEAVVDFYPYWYAWVSFSVESGIIRNNQAHQNFL